MTKQTIELLQLRIAHIESELSSSGPNEELIKEKMSHLKVIKMVHFLESNNIEIDKKVITLPYIDGHGYYAYRLMIDNEVSDPNLWTVVNEIDGEMAEFIMGDKIITS